MPHRRRRQARDLKYHHYEELDGTVREPEPMPFLEPAIAEAIDRPKLRKKLLDRLTGTDRPQ